MTRLIKPNIFTTFMMWGKKKLLCIIFSIINLHHTQRMRQHIILNAIRTIHTSTSTTQVLLLIFCSVVVLTSIKISMEPYRVESLKCTLLAFSLQITFVWKYQELCSKKVKWVRKYVKTFAGDAFSLQLHVYICSNSASERVITFDMWVFV